VRNAFVKAVVLEEGPDVRRGVDIFGAHTFRVQRSSRPAMLLVMFTESKVRSDITIRRAKRFAVLKGDSSCLSLDAVPVLHLFDVAVDTSETPQRVADPRYEGIGPSVEIERGQWLSQLGAVIRISAEYDAGSIHNRTCYRRDGRE